VCVCVDCRAQVRAVFMRMPCRQHPQHHARCGARATSAARAPHTNRRLLKDFLRQIGDVTYSHTVEGSGRG
jgi:hypothetical protein